MQRSASHQTGTLVVSAHTTFLAVISTGPVNASPVVATITPAVAAEQQDEELADALACLQLQHQGHGCRLCPVCRTTA